MANHLPLWLAKGTVNQPPLKAPLEATNGRVHRQGPMSRPCQVTLRVSPRHGARTPPPSGEASPAASPPASPGSCLELIPKNIFHRFNQIFLYFFTLKKKTHVVSTLKLFWNYSCCPVAGISCWGRSFFAVPGPSQRFVEHGLRRGRAADWCATSLSRAELVIITEVGQSGRLAAHGLTSLVSSPRTKKQIQEKNLAEGNH